MASIAQNVAAIRKAVYGIETREPIVDVLENQSKYDDIITREPRMRALEGKNQERVTDYELNHIEGIVDWIETVTHEIPLPPTIYRTKPSGSGISVSLIYTGNYKATDTKSGDSVTKIYGTCYKAKLGSDWSKTGMDSPYRTEKEEVIHYKQWYNLKFIRANE